jgi:hypothetical protein
MRDDEICRFGGILRPGFRRSLDCDPVATEDEQVEIELARAPPLAIATPERTLELLQGDEEGDGAAGRVRSARDVDGDDRVAERRLVDDADRLGREEPRDAVEAGAGQGRQRRDARRDRRLRIAEVRPEPDVCPNESRQGRASR